MDTLVARQPILDKSRRVIGYELLSRSSKTSVAYDNPDGNHATAQVIASGLFGIGFKRIVMGKLAFINFTREMLLQGCAEMLPKESVVIEILETVEPDDQVLAACRRLKRLGYRLALDDYVDEPRFQPLADCVEIVKFDLRSGRIDWPAHLMRGFQSRRLKALAEKVETYEEFNQVRNMGYTYFQGYFFARPALVAGREAPALKLSYLHLLEAIQKPELDYDAIEAIIRQEVSFAYKLLRYINAARFSRRNRIDAITQALLLMGDDEIRRWGSLIVLSGTGDKKPRELVVLALMRARFCESLASLAGLGGKRQALFLMGMFSLLDALMDRTLEGALEELPLDTDVAGTLLGRSIPDSRYATIHRLTRAYEAGDWTLVAEESRTLGVADDSLSDIYAEAVEWSEQTIAG